MRSLHIVQGDSVDDRAWLDRASGRRVVAKSWIAPKSAQSGDVVVIYVGGFGFYATGRVTGSPRPRQDWGNRYGAPVGGIRLIDPPISLDAIRRHVPRLTWAIYPRSITTPNARCAAEILALIQERRRTRLPDLDDRSLENANLEELRSVALLRARPSAPRAERLRVERLRSAAIRRYVLRRANGSCEGCRQPAPFRTPKGEHYLEPHHTRRLADDGPDNPRYVIALCPNCHRHAHYAEDAKAFNAALKRRLSRLERLRQG